MTTITMTVTHNGTTYPLHRMAWYQVRPDGTTTGSLLAVIGGQVIATPDQAKEWFNDGRRRAMAKDDSTYELAPLDEVTERLGHAR